MNFIYKRRRSTEIDILVFHSAKCLLCFNEELKKAQNSIIFFLSNCFSTCASYAMQVAECKNAKLPFAFNTFYPFLFTSFVVNDFGPAAWAPIDLINKIFWKLHASVWAIDFFFCCFELFMFSLFVCFDCFLCTKYAHIVYARVWDIILFVRIVYA